MVPDVLILCALWAVTCGRVCGSVVVVFVGAVVSFATDVVVGWLFLVR